MSDQIRKIKTKDIGCKTSCVYYDKPDAIIEVLRVTKELGIKSFREEGKGLCIKMCSSGEDCEYAHAISEVSNAVVGFQYELTDTINKFSSNLGVEPSVNTAGPAHKVREKIQKPEFKYSCVSHSKPQAVAEMLRITEELGITPIDDQGQLCVRIVDDCNPVISLNSLSHLTVTSGHEIAESIKTFGVGLVDVFHKLKRELEETQRLQMSQAEKAVTLERGVAIVSEELASLKHADTDQSARFESFEMRVNNTNQTHTEKLFSLEARTESLENSTAALQLQFEVCSQVLEQCKQSSVHRETFPTNIMPLENTALAGETTDSKKIVALDIQV